VLLLTPGFLTDIAGLALLFPPTRRAIQRFVRKRLERGIAEGSISVATLDGSPGFGTTGRAAGREPGAPPGLDPSKSIVIEPDDR